MTEPSGRESAAERLAHADRNVRAFLEQWDALRRSGVVRRKSYDLAHPFERSIRVIPHEEIIRLRRRP